MISAAISRRDSSGGSRRRRPAVVVARASACDAQQGADARRTPGRRPASSSVTPKRAQVVERDVEAADAEILLHVAQDVGQLQRDAEIDRVVARLRRPGSRRSRTQIRPTADATRWQYSIQLGEGLERGGGRVHRDAVDQVRRTGRAAGRTARMNGCSARPCGVCGADAVVAGEAARELARATRRAAHARRRDRRPSRARLVDRVVDGAAEVPDGDDRAPLRRRQDEERVVEAGLAGHVPGMPRDRRPRQRTARQSSPGTSPAPSVGRRRRAVGAGAVDALEDPHAAEPGHAQLEAQPAARRRRRPAGPASNRPRVRRTASAKRVAPGRRSDAARRDRLPAAPQAAADVARHVEPAAARQSTPKSCQKLVSCSAVHSASDDRSSVASR